MRHQHRTRQTIAQGFLVLFTLMLLNGIVFRHAHKLSSGKVITHAHPYKPVGNSPYQPNTHTDNELYLLDAVSNAIFSAELGTALVLAALVVFLVQKSSFFVYRQRFLARLVAVASLRGPPVLNV